MASQTYATPPSRNPQTAAEGFASGAKAGIVPAPAGKVTLGKSPEHGSNQHSPGAAVSGFAGGLIDGKVRV